MTVAALPIEPLSRADLDATLALSLDRGWRPSRRRWALLLEQADAYGIRAPDGGLAACVTLTPAGVRRRPPRAPRDVLGVEALVRASSAAFVAVYVAATAAGFRILDGRARACAAVSFAVVAVVLAFSGPYLLVPAAVAALAVLIGRDRRRAVLVPCPDGHAEARPAVTHR